MTLKRNMAIIDLERMTVDLQPIPGEWRRKYLGGRGLGDYLLMKHAPPDCDPLGPDNVLVISAGPAAGTPLAPIAATYLITKSALSDRLTCALLDGLPASGLRWAGFDHLVIKGRAETPVWLDVCDGRVILQDARPLWGAGIRDTRAALRSAVGAESPLCLMIGPAAENRIRFATLTTDKGISAGRAGIAAVMGAKNVKAVVMRGGLDIAVKHPRRLLAESRALLASFLSGAEGHSDHPALNDAVFALGDLPLSGCGGRRIPAEAGLGEYARELGLDVTSTQTMIAWGERLFKQGVLPCNASDEAPGPPADVRAWIRCIAYREGIGDVLAQGPEQAASILGHDSLRLFEPTAQLLKLYTEDVPDPLVYLKPGAGNPAGPQAENIPRREIEMLETPDYAGIFGPISRPEINRMIWDCAGVCPAARPDHNGNLDGLAQLLRSLTGSVFTLEDLETIAYRAAAIERLFNHTRDFGNDTPRLPLEGLERLRLSEAQWLHMDLDEYRGRLAACRTEKGWDDETIECAENWNRIGIDDLRPAG